MAGKALMSAMNTSYSTTTSSGPGDGKLMRNLKSASKQRQIKRYMNKKEKASASSNNPSKPISNNPSKPKRNSIGDSKIKDVAGKYANPVKYKLQQLKKEVKGKIGDAVAQVKQNSAERKNKRAGAGGEGSFEVCGPGGCKEGKYGKGRGI